MKPGSYQDNSWAFLSDKILGSLDFIEGVNCRGRNVYFHSCKDMDDIGILSLK